MDRDRFDQLALLVGCARSRREVLRLLAAGGATAVTVRSPRPAAAAICPTRVPRPGYTPTVNGCGPDGYDWFVPDTWNDADFTGACSRHDSCYGTCNRNRDECDEQFLDDMKAACLGAYHEDKPSVRRLYRRCVERAKTYHKGVSKLGQSAYEDAQEEACICCGRDGQGPICGNTCCSEGWSCCDGRFCSQGPCECQPEGSPCQQLPGGGHNCCSCCGCHDGVCVD